MEQRSPKLQGREKKVQTSCIWGLVDIFDFRSGRTNQKLLTNGRRAVQKPVSDFEHSRKVHTMGSCHGRRESFKGGEGLVVHPADSFEESMKILMKQKYGNRNKSKKQKKSSKKHLVLNSDMELVNQLQDYQKKNPGRKPSMESDQVHMQQRKDKFLLGPDYQSHDSAEISLDKHKLEAKCKEICSQVFREEMIRENMIERISSPSNDNEIVQTSKMQLLQIATKAFVDQIYADRKNKNTDGLDILNLNMDSFLKLLQDSKHNSQFPLMDNERMKFHLDSNSTGCRGDETRNDQYSLNSIKIQKGNSKNPLWKKLKYQYGCSSAGNTSSSQGSSNMIVILKPSKKYEEDVSCHCSSHESLKNKEQVIKKKFRQSVGESQQKQPRISMDECLRRLARNKHLLKHADKGKNSDSVKGKSVISRVSKTKEKQLGDPTSSSRSKTARIGGTTSCCETSAAAPDGCSNKQRQIDVFSEAKRHLSARLRKVEMGEIEPRKEAPRTLKMILSLPENDFLTTPSPKRDKNASTSTSMQMRHSPCNTHFNADSSRFDESASAILQRTQAEAIDSIADIHGSPSGSANSKANEAVTTKNSNILEIPYDLNATDDVKDRLETETIKSCKENGYMQSSNLIIPSENHSHKPSSCLNIHELEIANTAKYKEEHTSPVSVLQQPFSPEDFNSPTSIMSKPGADESSLQPCRLTFDDCSQVISQEDSKFNTNPACIDMDESLLLYMKEIIESSSFDNQNYLKGPSQQDILYRCIAEMMGLYSFESYNELQLLFDCIHEILLRIYQSFFGYPPWTLSFLQQKIRPVPREKEMVDEVIKEVNFYLLPKTELPTLDQLVEEDIVKFAGSWLDVRLDAEEILIQIAEDVLQDSIEDAVLEVLI